MKEIEVIGDTQLTPALTPAFAKEAAKAEREVQQFHGQLGINYLKFAAVLSNFKRNKYYLGLDFKTFDLWADSPALQGIGWRTARNLIRIVDEAIPLIEKHNMMKLLPSISTMYDLLPILNDENGEDKFIEALQAVQGLATRDAKARIKEIRGIPEKVEAEGAVFELLWEAKGTESKRIKIKCSTPEDMYFVCDGVIQNTEWPQFEALFKGNVREATA